VSKHTGGNWVAFISGLGISSSDVQPGMDDALEIRLQLLVEYLKGETGGPQDQSFSAQCSALIVLGNSLDIPRKSQDDLKNSVSAYSVPCIWSTQLRFQKRYNSQTTWDPAPLRRFTRSLQELARSVTVHILPGSTDPAPSTLPQQPMPKAMFGFEGFPESQVFMSETNPVWLDIGAWG
jgi:DNA polymerase delta subunit 2